MNYEAKLMKGAIAANTENKINTNANPDGLITSFLAFLQKSNSEIGQVHGCIPPIVAAIALGGASGVAVLGNAANNDAQEIIAREAPFRTGDDVECSTLEFIWDRCGSGIIPGSGLLNRYSFNNITTEPLPVFIKDGGKGENGVVTIEVYLDDQGNLVVEQRGDIQCATFSFDTVTDSTSGLTFHRVLDEKGNVVGIFHRDPNYPDNPNTYLFIVPESNDSLNSIHLSNLYPPGEKPDGSSYINYCPSEE